jgi:hypothetical protein
MLQRRSFVNNSILKVVLLDEYVIVSERLQFFVKFNLLQFIQEILFFKGNY